MFNLQLNLHWVRVIRSTKRMAINRRIIYTILTIIYVYYYYWNKAFTRCGSNQFIKLLIIHRIAISYHIISSPSGTHIYQHCDHSYLLLTDSGNSWRMISMFTSRAIGLMSKSVCFFKSMIHFSCFHLSVGGLYVELVLCHHHGRNRVISGREGVWQGPDDKYKIPVLQSVTKHKTVSQYV